MSSSSYAFRQTTIPAQSKNKVVNDDFDLPVSTSDDLADPFGNLGLDLSESELRETAYEILVGACRTSGSGRPLTYVSNSERSLSTSSSSSSLQRSLKSAAASKVKKALGLKSKKKGSDAVDQSQDLEKPKRVATAGELLRVQMKVSEQTDSRVRRALLRIAAAQLGRRIESIVLPLELLHQFKSSDFPSQREFEAWQKRNLKILEAGIILHPHLPLDKANSASQQLQQIIHGALERPMETGKNGEPIQSLRNAVMSLACRSFDGSVSEICHWADGAPFNLRLYQILLEACFDVDEETSIVEEVDEVLELLKKTWTILGINQMLHNLCFSWVLFHRYVTTGQIENDLLFAADSLLLEVEKDAKATKDPVYSKILSSILCSILGWAEKRLLAYHDTFYRGNIDVMQGILSLGMSATKICVENSQEYHRRRKGSDVVYSKVDSYIRSSLRNAFAQVREKIKLNRRSSKHQQSPLPLLSILAQEIVDLAFNEKEIYGPILKRWHSLAIGVAVATLHACYGKELMQFVSGISELSPDAIQVLIAADKLEKDLVQMAVEDSEDSEDGGKAIIQEMTPYEAEGVIVNLAKSWIKTRVERFNEWANRNLQQEVWNPGANKEQCARSAVEVLRIMDETIDAFFLLPIPMHPALLPDLMNGLDRCLQSYIVNAKSGCGSRKTFLPTIPALTRCTTNSKFGVLRKKDKSSLADRRKSQVGSMNGNNSIGIQQLCVRINTLHLIRRELGVFEKRALSHFKNTGSIHVGDDINGSSGKYFELSTAACVEGIQQLSDTTAYKVIFHDLSHALWHGLYVGEVSSSRIEPFLQELEQVLEILSTTVSDRVRTRVITDVMKASFDGFLLILLAGGPSRAYTLQDSAAIEEDFKFLMDLFWSNGDGLPTELIDKLSITVKRVLPLLHSDTESLIGRFKDIVLGSHDNVTKSKLPMPPTTGQWGPNEPNTILRVLCHRNDAIATKFLKKTYNLPKKL